MLNAGGTTHFPTQLHRMLTTTEDVNGAGNRLSRIVAWQPHGKCFLIHNQEAFSTSLLPNWFPRLKYPSFQRQLHKHGFRRLHSQGPDKGAYYHEMFQRGNADLASGIRPTKGGGKRGRKPQATEPNFHDTHTTSPSPSQDNLAGYDTAQPGNLTGMIEEQMSEVARGTSAAAPQRQSSLSAANLAETLPPSRQPADLGDSLGGSSWGSLSAVQPESEPWPPNDVIHGLLNQRTAINAAATLPSQNLSRANLPPSLAGPTPAVQQSTLRQTNENQLQQQIHQHSQQLYAQLLVQQQLEEELRMQINVRQRNEAKDERND